MRRFLILLCIPLLAACSSGDDKNDQTATTASTTSTLPIAERQSEASQITDLLIAGKYDEVVSRFNAEMTAGLSAEGLRTAWQQVVAAYGPYKSRGTTTRSLSAVPQGFLVFDTPMTFGSEPSKSRVTFDADGKVAGLFILKANVP